MEENNNVQLVNQKNNNTMMILLILLILILAGALIYVLVIKPKDGESTNNDTTQPSTVVLTNDEAITIAKEKLEAANKLFEDGCNYEELYSEDSSLCYYDTLDNFKSKFYNIYSKQLEYEDVYDEYPLVAEKRMESNYRFVYAIKNNKVYHDNCTRGGGIYEGMSDFTVNSITSNNVEISYKINYYDFIEKYNEDGKIILVKEDGIWKILKATIIQTCNATEEVGK